MKKLTVLFFTLLTMLNCKNKEEKPENTTPREVVPEETLLPTLDLGCYVFNDEKNNISLEITENGREIKGILNYSLSEKDKNSGNFTGKLNEEILIGKYTFQSEGRESTREVAFKVDGKNLIEGYGDLNEDGTKFKDISNLNFSSTMPLTKTDCDKK